MRLLLSFAAACGSAAAVDFEPPVRVKGGDELVRVESPGYAAPALADLNGDGRDDLLVGQFNKGKIRVYTGAEGGKFAAGEWLMAEGSVAHVPGVW